MIAQNRVRIGMWSLAAAGLALGLCAARAEGPDEKADDIPAFARELPGVRAGEPIFQFNGRDLDGFTTFLRGRGSQDPNHVFTVKDGAVHISGQEFGGIITREEFENYHLVAEWKYGEETWASRKGRARDSGILVHCVGEEGAASGTWMESIECQIIEGGTGDFLMVGGKNKPKLTCETRVGPDGQFYFEKGGKAVTRDSGRFNWWGRDLKWKDEIGFRGRVNIEKPHGEWNRMEVICQGDAITIVLNGTLVNIGTRSSLTRGRIFFQSEGAEMDLRKFEVRPLL